MVIAFFYVRAIIHAMKKALFFLPLLLLGTLASCDDTKNAPVQLDCGTRIGLNEEVSARSHLTWIKKSKLKDLISDKGNFILLLHGSSDTCTCYSTFHTNVLVPYVKHHKALIYAIDLDEFESDSDYYGVIRQVGIDTLAIFRDGVLAYQRTTEDETQKWYYEYAAFNDWMAERALDAKIYYVNEEQLDAYYAGSQPFTVYFTLENCPDCRYLSRNALRKYLQNHKVTEENFFYFDVVDYWKSDDTKAAIKAKYGLSYSEDNTVGLDKGYVPTVYHINPDGIHLKGDVIEAAGVFYNEKITDGIVSHTYFTQERLDEAKNTYLTYLNESNLTPKVLEGLNVGAVPEGGNWHDLLAPYEDPIFNALLDYAIGSGN